MERCEPNTLPAAVYGGDEITQGDSNGTPSAVLVEPGVVDLLGGLDPKLVEACNARRYRIAYLTAGEPRHPCVVVPPGGGATKEENLFWARELAAIGPFFVVMYDLRGSGASEPKDRWAAVFAATSPVREMERVIGVQSRPHKGGETRNGPDATDGTMAATGDDDLRRAGSLRTHTRKTRPAPLDPAISQQLHDFDAYAEDAFAVLDELGIRQAHFVGLSQGGTLARLAATLHPERVLSVVSCASAASKLGLMMAAFSAGAEDFYDRLKAAQLYDDDGRPLWAAAGDGGDEGRRATRDEYVSWRSKLLEVVVPGFDRHVYEEMAGGSWDAGYMDETEAAVAALAYEAWCAAPARPALQYPTCMAAL